MSNVPEKVAKSSRIRGKSSESVAKVLEKFPKFPNPHQRFPNK
jgi:hypothetical protein